MDGLHVRAVHDAESGIREGAKDDYELVILDVMLPGGDGRKVLRRIRMNSQVPVIMLTARGDETDRIAGIEAGADDYLPKPFSPCELVARIRAVLRRKGTAALPEAFEIGDLHIDSRTRRVVQNGAAIELTGAEFDILFLLVRAAGRVLSRDEIAEEALGRPVRPARSQRRQSRQRPAQKTRYARRTLKRIRSVRGAGYIYTGDDSAATEGHE